MSKTDNTKKKGGGAKLNFFFILGLILAILIIVFGLANQETEEINFLVFSLEINLVLLIFLCIAVGSILTLLFSLPGVFRRRRVKKDLEKELKDLRKQYEELAKINPSNPKE